MPERRRRKPLVISRRTGGIMVCVVAAVLGYGAVTVVEQGRRTAGAHWAVAVTAGAGASLALIALLAVMVAAARWRRRASAAISLAMRVVLSAFLLITWAGLVVANNTGPVASPLEVGLAAFVVPVGCLTVIIAPLVTWRKKSPSAAGPVLVATVTASGDHWAVGWIGLGRKPGPLRAATLTAAVDETVAGAVALRGSNATELRMVIYPGPFRRGVTFEISGEPGDLTAAAQGQPGKTYRGASLETLADAIGQTHQDSRKGFRLRWTRPRAVPGAMTSPAAGQDAPAE